MMRQEMSQSEQQVLEIIKIFAKYSNDCVIVQSESECRKQIGKLAELAALGDRETKAFSQYCIRSIAQNLGIFPASIHDLYMGKGCGEIPLTFTVPAINLRVMTYDAARIVFKAALKINGAAFIFEIARSEMGYTDQKPGEYASAIFAAAISEGYKGPIFIQGDHFQISMKKFQLSPDKEIASLKGTIIEAISAGFYNIDIDMSTLVDLTKKSLTEQQFLNVKNSFEFTTFIRSYEPMNINISIGGEIGEVGGHNSTESELRVYLDEYKKCLNASISKLKGLSKVAVQTGTSHGGIVLPDGSIAKVHVDFDTLRTLSRVARLEYGLGGVVQHGASTLPQEAFGKFVEDEACEVHLATSFMNAFFDLIPYEFKNEMYKFLDKEYSSERKPEMTNEQFYYKSRKNAIGPFKRKSWDLSPKVKSPILKNWESQFTTIFKLLGIENTKTYVDTWIPKIIVAPKLTDYYPENPLSNVSRDLAD
jgi:fructose/tagatose bisphosphate aldolase